MDEMEHFNHSFQLMTKRKLISGNYYKYAKPGTMIRKLKKS